MSWAADSIPEDILDRIVESFTSGGPESESAADVERLLGDHASSAVEYEVAAAATALAFGLTDPEAGPMPKALRASLLETARLEGFHGTSNGAAPGIAGTPAEIQAQPRSTEPLRFSRPEAARTGSNAAARLGWLAAAACLLIAAAAWWPASTNSAGDPSASRTGLVAAAPDLVQWDWAAWGDGYGDVGGDVVWSEARQEGYMRLVGLPANDPAESQYQLWIVESSRGVPLETEPVDGGVFDVPADANEVVVPIRSKLRSQGVAAFAVTIERPGGVVVSDQSRRVVIAGP